MNGNKILLNNLRSNNINLIKESLEKIGDLNLKIAIDPIIDLINNTESEEIIDAAIWTLSRIAPIDKLIDLLKIDNETILYYTIEALGRLNATGSARFIREFLDHSNPKIRAIATWTIGKIYDVNSYNKLIELLKNDSSPEVRTNAAWALKKINVLESLKILEQQKFIEKDESVLYNIDEAIKSIESSYNINPDREIEIYKCKFMDNYCNEQNKEHFEFKDSQIYIKITCANFCIKSKICNLIIKRL